MVNKAFNFALIDSFYKPFLMYLLKLTTFISLFFLSFVSINCQHFEDEDCKKEPKNFIIKLTNTLNFKNSA
jgi:hypothetical protein